MIQVAVLMVMLTLLSEVIGARSNISNIQV
ncbi:unnamed protein product [Gongylonema pulchrum]|uniref:Chemokine (C-C motif) ligand 14 n=1 Tax=Gongylonema pulchrum TaxID=637853 RepID=A0A183DH99_9BILA|nr:unnamed protein product [Gongylonema pulchrum]